jgi:hypothetical protein
MPCYILRAGDTDNVKIGWTDQDVEARRGTLQSAHWLDLVFLRLIEGESWIERAMHRRFAANRINREWFVFHPDMLTHIPEAPKPRPTRTRPDLVSWAADRCRHPWPCDRPLCNLHTTHFSPSASRSSGWSLRPPETQARVAPESFTEARRC